MKSLNAFILIAITTASSTGWSWVNDVFFVEGKVRSVDQKVIQLETPRYRIDIPRDAVPKAYKLSTAKPKAVVPVLAKHFDEMKWQRIPASTPLKDPEFSSAKILKHLRAELAKAKGTR